MENPVDIIMWAGEEHYTVSSFIREAEKMGVSKRIPRTTIPEGIISGQSRILIKHRKAIVQGELEELPSVLYSCYGAPLFNLPDDMLHLVTFLEDMHEEDHENWAYLVDEFSLTWMPGVIGYGYITGVQYIAHDHEEGLPEDLQHLDYLIEPVRLEHENN